jgi:hypothetical protein
VYKASWKALGVQILGVNINYKELYRDTVKNNKDKTISSEKIRREIDKKIINDDIYNYQHKLMNNLLTTEKDKEIEEIKKKIKSKKGIDTAIKDIDEKYNDKLRNKYKQLQEDMFNYDKYKKLREEYIMFVS